LSRETSIIKPGDVARPGVYRGWAGGLRVSGQASLRRNSAGRSAIITTVVCGLAETIAGMTDARLPGAPPRNPADETAGCRTIVVRWIRERRIPSYRRRSPYHRGQPPLAPEELAGHKLLALFDRAAARDFADVYVLARRFGKDALITRAAQIDAGFDTTVPADMMATLDRFTGSEIPVPEGSSAAELRAFYAAWQSELTA